MKKKSADQIIKEIFTNYFKESGYSLDKKKSLHRFKERYGFSEYEESTQKVKSSRFLNSLKSFKDAYIKFLELIKDNLKNFMKYFVSISLGFSVAFVPVVNNTVRSYSESLFDKLISFEFLQEKIETKVIQTETLEYELNEIVNEAMLSKQPIELKPFPNGYSLKISNFKANEPDQASLKIKLKVHSTFEGNLKVEIIKK